MPKLRVHAFTMSVDGFVAGPDQSLDHPLGVRGTELHPWVFAALERGEGLDHDILRAADEGVGATIMGRNMFGPVRGAWGSEDWRGWWGPEPPYHHPVFVLTHYVQPPIPMQAGPRSTFSTAASRTRSSRRSRPRAAATYA
jgi:dihydrofolate reductase